MEVTLECRTQRTALQPTSKDEVIKMVSGFFYRGGNAKAKPVKGTITPEMMTSLLALTISVAPQYHDGQVVQFGVALRQCQLIDI